VFGQGWWSIGVHVTRTDVGEIERKLHGLKMQLAGLLKEQQVYMQDIVDITLQYQEHLEQLQAAQYQYRVPRRAHA
jgi:hypothetical protein